MLGLRWQNNKKEKNIKSENKIKNKKNKIKQQNFLINIKE